MSTEPAENRRLNYIDALRGVAILMVILSHCHPYFTGINNYYLSPTVDSIIRNGDKGVTLFYVISAYTLCLSFSQRKTKEKRPLKNYFIRRFFRIVPLYYFAIIIHLIVTESIPNMGSILANILLIHGFNPYWINSTVPGGWSVGIEVLFYLIFPIIFLKVKSVYNIINLTLITIIIAKIVTSIMFKNPLIDDGVLWGIFVYENVISQLPVFLIGVCLFFIQFPKDKNKKPSNYLSFLFLALVIILQLLEQNIFKDHYLFAISFAFAAFGLANFPAKVMVNPLLIWIGKHSFSLYLMHTVVLKIFAVNNIIFTTSNVMLEVVLRFLACTVLSCLISVLTYSFIEVPFQSYGKRIINKLEGQAA